MTNNSDDGSSITGSQKLYSIEYEDAGGPLTPNINQSMIDLYRSFTLGNVVAFVGSGASASLGHCRWGELSEGLAKAVVTGICRAHEILPEKIDEYLGDFTDAEDFFKKIDASDSEMKEKFKDHYRGLCNEILTALVKKKEENLDTFDVLAITGNAYRRALSMKQAYEDQKIDVKKADAIKKEVAAYYQRDFYLKAPFILSGEYHFNELTEDNERNEKIKKQIDKLIANINRQPRENGGDKKLIPPDYKSGIDLIANLAEEEPQCVQPRASKPVDLISSPRPAVDILGCLRNEWKITRYATLNFDHEIERMLERGDYPFYSLTHKRPEEEEISFADEQTRSQSRLGEKARTVDLNEKNVAELMLFAADCPAGSSQVLHLHGSITHPDEMIVTDGDYNRRYFASNTVNDVLSDGQDLFFRGNAIIFVGVGMSEDELLRAARIMAQSTDRGSRPVYALMNSTGEAKDNAVRIKLYERYGIHTIFYGTSLDDDPHDEIGRYQDHRLVKQATAHASKRCADDNRELQPLAEENKFLKRMIAYIDADEVAITENEKQELQRDISLVLDCSTSDQISGCKEAIKKWPRLLLTDWHNDVFRLVCGLISDSAYCKKYKSALKTAIYDLESAIQARALEDALLLIAKKAVEWKKRWKKPPIFRDYRLGTKNDIAHNISMKHMDYPARKSMSRAYMDSVLADASGTKELDIVLGKAEDFFKKSTAKKLVTILRSGTGSGKGIIATHFASGHGKKHGTRRVAVSFGQSCGRDSCFDLIANAIKSAAMEISGNLTSGSAIDSIEVMLLQTDIAMTRSQGRPRLAEWDFFFRKTISNHAIKTHVILLCEHEETASYFKYIIPENNRIIHHSGNSIKDKKSFYYDENRNFSGGSTIATRREWRETFFKIVSHCDSVWLASFLNAVYEEIKHICGGNEDAARPHIESMIDRIEYALDVTQDPRQCVTVVIDAALLQLEHTVYVDGDFKDRLTHVIAHAILKHLFAFGGPVRDRVFAFCPEISKIIFEEYPVKSKENKILRVASIRQLAKAIHWLQKMDLITTLHYGFDGKPRYGLHGPMRNYLAVKKGLPFSVVLGREQTAITLLPIIDEEIVPLKAEDYDFIWKTLDGLLIGHAGNGKKYASEMIRAAFMLLRGSMRIGTVLRSHKSQTETDAFTPTPLNRYFQSLLRIRAAALSFRANASNKNNAALSEREWIWLFNEMGVVKLLQGHVHDATSFFEAAVKFEIERIEERRGFEWSIEKTGRSAEDAVDPKFTLTKLRILFNLAISEIERGAFNRAKRILASEGSNLQKLKMSLAPDAVVLSQVNREISEEERSGKSKSAMPTEDKPDRGHREIRILELVAGLIGARLNFLSGASGEAMLWLKNKETAIIEEAVHGLTGWYYLIRADTEMSGKNPEQWKRYLATARAETEASGRSDLILSVMLAESQFELQQQSSRTSGMVYHHLTRIHEIRRDAKRLGMSRILVSASLNRAKLYMSLREYRSARHDLLSAISLSTSNGLSIKRVSGLIELAALVGLLSNRLRGEAGDIAEAACNEAERIGYKMAAMRATELQIVLREHGSIEEWAAGPARAGVSEYGGPRN